MPDASTVLGIGVHSVSLYTADSDRIFTMADAAGRSVMVRNAQDTVTAYFYEHPELGGRPLLITETPPGGVPRARSMTVWRMPGSEHRARNLALMPLTEYDNAGSSAMLSMSLTGQPLEAEQRLLPADAPPPDRGPDSPCIEVSLITSGACDATCSLLSQKDAAGGVTTTAYNITGAVSRVSLTTSDGMEYGALSSVKRAADGRVIMQSAGNGMAQVWEYDMRTRRLSRHLTLNRDGVLLSELRYTYEPAGNMLTLSNAAVNTQWHRNGESGGVRAYLYDTLSRLLSVESRQKKVAASRPGPFPGQQADGSAGLTWVRYAECYTYDDGDNLIKTVRKGSACGNGWTRNTLMSRRSNREVIATTPGKKAFVLSAEDDPHNAFFTGGLMKALKDGRALRWPVDGTLPGVAIGTEKETYTYSSPGVRARKRTALAGSEVRLTTYAGGCEWRQRTEHENLLSAEAVITEVACLGVIRTRVNGQTAWLARWSWRDHLGSLSGETDENGAVSSREEYAPYGESLGADDDELSINKRTRRFSGMERDATGLYYYGWRYYQPGAGRWLNADPGGLIDGVNLFRFCKTNPIRFIDADGKKPSPAPDNYFNDPRMNDPDTKKKVADLLEIYPLGDGRGYEHFGPDTIDMWKKWNSRQGRSSAKIDHIEYGALEMYTRTYMMTNQALLDDSPEESLKNYVSAANSGIKKLAEADGRQSESFLFRGMRVPADNFFIRLNSGDVFRTKNFFSTSRSMRTAKDFSRPVFEGQYPVLIGLSGLPAVIFLQCRVRAMRKKFYFRRKQNGGFYSVIQCRMNCHLKDTDSRMTVAYVKRFDTRE